MASENFKAKDIAFRAQKKLLSRMSNKATLKLFIEDGPAAVLDDTYRLFKQYTGNKKESEKLIKAIIKTIVKIGILDRSGKFNDHELKIAFRLHQNFEKTALTLTSFYELEFSYDYNHFNRLLDELHNDLVLLVRNHLSQKSLDRIQRVFSFCKRQEFCDRVFQKDLPYREIMTRIISTTHELLESKPEQ